MIEGLELRVWSLFLRSVLRIKPKRSCDGFGVRGYDL